MLWSRPVIPSCSSVTVTAAQKRNKQVKAEKRNAPSSCLSVNWVTFQRKIASPPHFFSPLPPQPWLLVTTDHLPAGGKRRDCTPAIKTVKFFLMRNLSKLKIPFYFFFPEKLFPLSEIENGNGNENKSWLQLLHDWKWSHRDQIPLSFSLSMALKFEDGY